MFKIFQEFKTIKWLSNRRYSIDFSPAYQRRGNIWKLKQKQLLIDSILNGFDIPKFYFQFMPDRTYNYAIIDGKQRIETILGFIDGDFPLAKDFKFFDRDMSMKFGNIANCYYDEIDSIAPTIIARLLQYELSIVFMDTDTPDSVNEMFIRLNSGIPVSTAEKRNAMGGRLSQRIQTICDTSIFFNASIAINNMRFQHNDLAIKLLMLECGYPDLTKNSVDRFIEDNRDVGQLCEDALIRLEMKLQKLSEVFQRRDKLLSKKNIIITLYTMLNRVPYPPLRELLKAFEDDRARAQREEQPQNGELSELIEFSRLLQQGADKKSSIQERSQIMMKYYEQYIREFNITFE